MNTAAKTVPTNRIMLHPLKGRILLQIDGFTYSGKIIVPEAAKRLPSTGTVVAIGEGVTQVGPGDRVALPMYSGTSLSFRDKTTEKELPPFRMVTEDEILGIFSNDDIMLVETGT